MTHSSETSAPLTRWLPLLGGADLTFAEDSGGVGSVTASIAFNEASPTLCFASASNPPKISWKRLRFILCHAYTEDLSRYIINPMPPPRNPADRYTYRLFWSSDDDCFVGTCVEFPSLSHLADTDESALMGIRDLVAAVLRDLKSSKSHIPTPVFSRPRLVG